MGPAKNETYLDLSFLKVKLRIPIEARVAQLTFLHLSCTSMPFCFAGLVRQTLPDTAELLLEEGIYDWCMKQTIASAVYCSRMCRSHTFVPATASIMDLGIAEASASCVLSDLSGIFASSFLICRLQHAAVCMRGLEATMLGLEKCPGEYPGCTGVSGVQDILVDRKQCLMDCCVQSGACFHNVHVGTDILLFLYPWMCVCIPCGHLFFKRGCLGGLF